MRCKKHPADLSSATGVCASCLRERLFSVIAAQAQSQALKQAQAQKDCRKSEAEDPPPPPLSFPRSVSPYISRRKSDAASAATWRGHHHRFFSTPQVGPAGSFAVEAEKESKKGKRGRSISSLFFGLFRSKSDKPCPGPGPVSDRGVSVDSCSASSSSSWFSANFITGRRKKKVRKFSIDEHRNGGAQRRICRDRDRGMSPARHSDDGGSSGYSSDSAQGWMRTPRRTPASARGKNASGLKLCLSPLVRASPNRHWSQKGLPPEMAVSGESRASAKPYLSAAASFCKNRSRKLADFGRYNYDPTHH